MKLKKKSTLPLLWLTLKVMAEVLIYIAFLCLIVGAIVLYLLWNWCEMVIPPSQSNNNNTNTVVSTTITTHLIGDVPGAMSDNVIQQSGNQFSMQYGLFTADGTTLTPWIEPAGQYQLGTNGEAEVVRYGGQEGETLVVTEGTQLFVITMTTNGVVDAPVGEYTGIIIRSTNMIDWTPVFTNSSMVVDGVYTYTDQSNSPRAFYRLEF